MPKTPKERNPVPKKNAKSKKGAVGKKFSGREQQEFMKEMTQKLKQEVEKKQKKPQKEFKKEKIEEPKQIKRKPKEPEMAMEEKFAGKKFNIPIGMTQETLNLLTDPSVNYEDKADIIRKLRKNRLEKPQRVVSSGLLKKEKRFDGKNAKEYMEEKDISRKETTNPENNMLVRATDKVLVGSAKKEEVDQESDEFVIPGLDGLLMIPTNNECFNFVSSLKRTPGLSFKPEELGILVGGGASNLYSEDLDEFYDWREFARVLTDERIRQLELMYPSLTLTEEIPPLTASGHRNLNYKMTKEMWRNFYNALKDLRRATGKFKREDVGKTKEVTESKEKKLSGDVIETLELPEFNKRKYETLIEDSSDFSRSYFYEIGDQLMETKTEGGFAQIKSIIRSDFGTETYELREALNAAHLLDFGDRGKEKIIKSRIKDFKNKIEENIREHLKERIRENQNISKKELEDNLNKIYETKYRDKVEKTAKNLNEKVKNVIENFKDERSKPIKGTERTKKLKENLKRVLLDKTNKLTDLEKKYLAGKRKEGRIEEGKTFYDTVKEEIFKDEDVLFTNEIIHTANNLVKAINKDIPINIDEDHNLPAAALYSTFKSFINTDLKLNTNETYEREDFHHLINNIIDNYNEKVNENEKIEFINYLSNKNHRFLISKKQKPYKNLGVYIAQTIKDFADTSFYSFVDALAESVGYSSERDKKQIEENFNNHIEKFTKRLVRAIQIQQPKDFEDFVDLGKKTSIGKFGNISEFLEIFPEEEKKELKKDFEDNIINYIKDNYKERFDEQKYNYKIEINKRLKDLDPEEYTNEMYIKKGTPKSKDEVKVFEGVLEDVVEGIDRLNKIRGDPKFGKGSSYIYYKIKGKKLKEVEVTGKGKQKQIIRTRSDLGSQAQIVPEVQRLLGRGIENLHRSGKITSKQKQKLQNSVSDLVDFAQEESINTIYRYSYGSPYRIGVLDLLNTRDLSIENPAINRKQTLIQMFNWMRNSKLTEDHDRLKDFLNKDQSIKTFLEGGFDERKEKIEKQKIEGTGMTREEYERLRKKALREGIKSREFEKYASQRKKEKESIDAFFEEFE